MRHHGTIWLITGLVVLGASAILVARNIVEAPGVRHGEDPLIQRMLAAVGDDWQARREITRSLVAQAAALAESRQVETAETYYALGLRLRRQGRPGGAEAAYRKAILMRPEWSWPYDDLGIHLQKLGREDEAEALFRKAIELDPDWGRAHSDLGILLRLAGRLDEAQSEALRAIELDPDSVAAHNNYGNLLVALGRLDEAEKSYKKAMALDPTHPAPYYNLACLASLQGRPDDVFKLLEQAIQLDPAFREGAGKDPDLVRVRDHPKFKELTRP